MDQGPIFAMAASKADGPLANKNLRQSCASSTGITMYSSTEVTSVFQGTVMAESPNRNATNGANATTMMLSFKATCDKVNSGSPPVSRLQTKTIAVQGAAASKISPAT